MVYGVSTGYVGMQSRILYIDIYMILHISKSWDWAWSSDKEWGELASSNVFKFKDGCFVRGWVQLFATPVSSQTHGALSSEPQKATIKKLSLLPSKKPEDDAFRTVSKLDLKRWIETRDLDPIGFDLMDSVILAIAIARVMGLFSMFSFFF